MRAQASIWDIERDLNDGIGPCAQILFFKVRNGALELNVHMRASDAYGKLLMNIQEFVAVQEYVATQLSMPVGEYVQFIDSCHIYARDKESIEHL